MAIGFVIGVIAYRMTVRAALYLRDEELLYNNAGMVTSATAACINLIIIFLLNAVSLNMEIVYAYINVQSVTLNCKR